MRFANKGVGLMTFIMNLIKFLFSLALTLVLIVVVGWLLLVTFYKGASWFIATDMMQNFIVSYGYILGMFVLLGLVFVPLAILGALFSD